MKVCFKRYPNTNKICLSLLKSVTDPSLDAWLGEWIRKEDLISMLLLWWLILLCLLSWNIYPDYIRVELSSICVYFIIGEFRIYKILIYSIVWKYWYLRKYSTKVKCLVEGLNSRMEGIGINELKYRPMGISQSE